MTTMQDWFYRTDFPMVYRATCLVDGGTYIGATACLARRVSEHLSAAKTGKSRSPFCLAILEHGSDMFRFNLLKACSSIDEAREEEARLIAIMKPSYNRKAGGEGARAEYFTSEVRAKIGAASVGRRSALGRTASDRTRARLREVGLMQKGEWLKRSILGSQALSRRVVCLDDGQTFDSASAAARHYGSAKSAVIELCLGKRHRKSVNGRRFAYVEGDA